MKNPNRKSIRKPPTTTVDVYCIRVYHCNVPYRHSVCILESQEKSVKLIRPFCSHGSLPSEGFPSQP